jgi:uncharacterized membrane protein
MINKKSLFVFLFFFSFFILFSCISLWRFNITQVFYYDLGIFARPLWEITHGLPPLIFHKTLGEIHFLGDHFSPSMYLLTPLMWLPSPLQMLLIEQALTLTICGVLIFLIAHDHKLSFWVSIAVSFVFFIFAGAINPLVTDWHTEPTAAVFLLLFIYLYFYKKRYIWGMICAVIFLGWKESNALTLLLSLIPFFISSLKQRKHIIIIAICTILWFFLVTKIIIPSFIHQPYYYSPLLPSSPLLYIAQLFNNPQKRLLLFESFISFGFLPLFNISYLASIVGELAIRFIPVESHFQSITLGMHYNVFLGVFLTLGSIQTLSHLKGKKIQQVLIILFVILSLFAAKKITSSPIFLAFNRTFWREWSVPSPLMSKLSCIPLSGRIMSQNNILPHLIQRKEKIYLLSKKYKDLKPDYIVMDISPGQNSNNFYSGEISEYSQVETLKKMIEADIYYVRDTSTCPTLLFFRRIKSK